MATLTHQVTVFQTRQIAVAKSNGYSYSLLKWDVGRNSWDTYTLDFNAEQAQKYTLENSPICHVAINLHMLRGGPKNIQGTAHGDYLLYNTLVFPIVRIRSHTNLPERYKAQRYQIAGNSGIRPATLYTIVHPQEQLPPLVPRQEPIKVNIIKELPRRIAHLIAEDYINKGNECPITMMPLDITTTKVTTCYHVFDGAALDTWFQTNKSCPVCKEPCLATAT